MESIAETKVCKHCNSKFEITDKDLEFYEKVSPTFNLETGLEKERPDSDNELIKDLWNWKVKYLIPTPTLCPDCRQQKRLSFRNERKLYKRKCDLTNKDIISIYSPDKTYPVYEANTWKSDKYNPLLYWNDFDFSKPFFEQIWNLINKTPKQSVFRSLSCINSSYVNYCSWMSDCYLIFDSMESQNCMYWLKVSYCNNCIDCDYTIKSELCYYCSDCSDCYKLNYSLHSIDCKNSSFLNDCIWCTNCYMCKWLRNKSYYIKNIQYSKEEYHSILNRKQKKPLHILKLQFDDFSLKIPTRNCFINNSEKSTWNNINNSNNLHNCFDVFDVNNCKYSSRIFWSTDCYDYESRGHNTSKIYNSIWTWSNSSEVLFCVCTMSNTTRVLYSMLSTWCSDCFWCINMKDAKYCILNKQYTKEEYNRLVPKIIEHMMKTGEWWEFFPSSLSPFWYNETVAQEYFPLNRSDVIPAKAEIYSKEEVIKRYNDSEILKSNNSNESSKSFREFIDSWSSQEWQDSLKRPVFENKTGLKKGKIFNRSNYESPKPNVDKIIPASKLPEDISDIPDDILNWAIECEVTKKPFRIIKEELDFYRKHNLPIPRRHPDQRHLDRIKLRNPRKLYDRNCDKCGKDIKTTYSPERPEIVYCEECYNKEVY